MSFEGNDMLLRVLAERIKKKKLEEELPVKISGLANNTDLKDRTKYDSRKKSMDTARTALNIDAGYTPRSIRDFIINLKRLMTKGGKNTELSVKDIENASEKELIQIAFDIARTTTDGTIKQQIQDALSAMDANIGATYSAPAAATVDPLGTSSDIDIEQIQSMTFPEVNISDAAMNAGQFFGSQNDLINSVFTAGTIKERCAQFTAASKAVFAAAKDPSKVASKDVRKVIQYAMFTDLCNSYFNLMDARSTGYSFESLCAIFCGGKVIGGGNGAADFVTNSGTQGSSKKYSKWASIEQSAAGFGKSGDKSKVLHYVIGMPEQIKVAKGSLSEKKEEKVKFSDPDSRTAGVKLYYIVVTLTKEVDGIGHFVTSDPSGNPMSYQTMPLETGNHVDVIKNADQSKCLVGEFQLYSGKNSFKKVLDDKTKDNQSNFAKAYKKVNEFFKLMKQADEDSRKYISQSSKETSEILSHGNAAMEKMTKADSALEDMLKLLKPEGTTGDIATSNGTRTISESRQIADVVKEMKEKELKKR
jgi:hypothetical protein